LLNTAEENQQDSTLYPLQIAIEKKLSPAETSSAAGDVASSSADTTHAADAEHTSEPPASAVAVLAVVDSTALQAAAEEDEEQAVAAVDALRRERIVRQAINSALVANALIDVVQPDQESTETARAEIIAKNSAALSTALAAQIGEQLGAAILVCAMIDRLGAEVNIVAQNAHDGKLVYQDTIKDWNVTAGSAEEATE
jgi:hypothetical protein